MELVVQRDSDIDNWKEVMLIYSSALKQISTKLEILNDEFITDIDFPNVPMSTSNQG